jgi:hypothetical protein
VSCGAAGNCSAGGSYTDKNGTTQAFVVSETRGTWGNAEEVQGIINGSTGVRSVSCATTNHCSAGGGYTDGSQNEQAFVTSRS